MKKTELIMGMPITVEIIDSDNRNLLTETFSFFKDIDNRYSTYKPNSEISRINNGLPRALWSTEMKHIVHLCEQTKQQTMGYFDIKHNGKLDPSGLVKGWAIWQASQRLLEEHEIKHFYIEAGGDIQAYGNNAERKPWTVGIRNPNNPSEIIKSLILKNQGVATSGTYIRGQHIYDPHHPTTTPKGVKSLTVIGSNIYEADRFATASFAMGAEGINFIESADNLEGYMVNNEGIATFTSGFKEYIYA
ncbi:MAG: FAD:protein FMN transferase [Candidatus Saccharimonadales bacterium]